MERPTVPRKLGARVEEEVGRLRPPMSTGRPAWSRAASRSVVEAEVMLTRWRVAARIRASWRAAGAAVAEGGIPAPHFLVVSHRRSRILLRAVAPAAAALLLCCTCRRSMLEVFPPWSSAPRAPQLLPASFFGVSAGFQLFRASLTRGRSLMWWNYEGPRPQPLDHAKWALPSRSPMAFFVNSPPRDHSGWLGAAPGALV